MKSVLTSLPLLGIALLAASPSAFADKVTLNVNSFSSQYPGYDGGEFTAKLSGSGTPAGYAAGAVLSAGTFETFCVELNQEFSNGGTYDYTTSNKIQLGGPPSPGQPLALGVAYLYSQFAQGKLTGYDYSLTDMTGGSLTRELNNVQVQNAIWYLMGQETLAQAGATDPFIALAVAKTGGGTHAFDDANGAFGVSVLDLTSGTGSDKVYNQDQVIYNPVPDGGTTCVLVGISLLGVFLLRRRVAVPA